MHKYEKINVQFYPPSSKNVAYGILGLLIACAIVWLGYRDTRHNSIVWVVDRPVLYAPIFYSADSLNRYIEIAFHEDDPEALCIAGTSAYHLRYFDQAALDTLPAVPLEDADMMLLRSAWMGYKPAFTVINYLNTLGLWSHSIPTNEPTYIPDAPAKDDPDYIYMTTK